MKILGVEGMSPDRIQFEVQRGAKFVFFYYSVSVLVMSFRHLASVFHPRRRKRSGKGIALDPAHGGRWLVGHPMGPNLHCAVSGR
jgi:hypothetical protein